MQMKRVIVLYGGKADEHSISCISAANVMKSLDNTLFEIVPIGITKQGLWLYNALDPRTVDFAKTPLPVVEKTESSQAVVINMAQGADGFYVQSNENQSLINLGHIDVVLPVLHGAYGEDGTVQGMIEMLGIPYIGTQVLTSAVCIDKHFTKEILKQAGIAVVPSITIDVRRELKDNSLSSMGEKYLQQVKQAGLQYPLFVKPSRAGSSFGVTKVEYENSQELISAISEASHHDWRILIEHGVDAREIECAVFSPNPLGEPQASLPGEIVLDLKQQGEDQFYDFDSKYLDAESSHVEVPADVNQDVLDRVQDIAIRAFKAVDATGLSRVDCFVENNGNIMVNEINTMPGFTSTSLYPIAWNKMGVNTTELLTQLINGVIQ
ncbi:MAG: D-alanine--D-alanine ligase family protein [Bifidobacteriaceae bacterium]|nr:D-alanine--D-alanine ligase family protein [Bifidobacteriaceae bacterium]